jgi:F0F1-type ATP synthase assembly protein I
MAEDDHSSQKADNPEVFPTVPPLPELPEAPVMKPNLPPRAKRLGEEASQTQKMGLAYVLPTALAAPVVVLTLAGYWLDQRFHKSPYFTMGGALLGMISGFINMLRIANRLNR